MKEIRGFIGGNASSILVFGMFLNENVLTIIGAGLIMIYALMLTIKDEEAKE